MAGHEDVAAIASAAHALKSMCRNIGAVALGEQCEVIEGDARERDTRPTPDQLSEIDLTLARTIQTLRKPGPEAKSGCHVADAEKASRLIA